MASIMKRGTGNQQVPANGFGGLVDQLFQSNLQHFFNDENWGFKELSRSANVPVNIKETDKTFELDMIAPGLKKEDFKLNVQDNMLTISFEHNEQNTEQNTNESWLRREYRQQSFTRSFTLDDTVDANKISASYQDGVLHLTLPKKEGAQKVVRNIEIN